MAVECQERSCIPNGAYSSGKEVKAPETTAAGRCDEIELALEYTRVHRP